MDRNVRQSGLALIVAGAAAGLFFWWTDPQAGLRRPPASSATLSNAGAMPGAKDEAREATYATIDQAAEARVGTAVGLTGAGVVSATGLWLLTRRMS